LFTVVLLKGEEGIARGQFIVGLLTGEDDSITREGEQDDITGLLTQEGDIVRGEFMLLVFIKGEEDKTRGEFTLGLLTVEVATIRGELTLGLFNEEECTAGRGETALTLFSGDEVTAGRGDTGAILALFALGELWALVASLRKILVIWETSSDFLPMEGLTPRFWIIFLRSVTVIFSRDSMVLEREIPLLDIMIGE